MSERLIHECEENQALPELLRSHKKGFTTSRVQRWFCPACRKRWSPLATGRPLDGERPTTSTERMRKLRANKKLQKPLDM
jgi:transposase-like protein